jgi:hypothetical protein
MNSPLVLVHQRMVHNCGDNRVIRIVRKTQHQNPEFGHTEGEIFFKPTKDLKKSTLAFNGNETQKTINFGGKLSFILSFLSRDRLHRCYIYLIRCACLVLVYFHRS